MKEKKQLLEAGKIVNTHGVRGDIKIDPWCDSPDVFCSLKKIYIDGVGIKLRSARVHGHLVIASLEGIATIDDAIRLKNKVVFAERDELPVPEGHNFVQDLIGLDAVDDATGEILGKISDILPLPSGNIYEIKGERTILIPAVPDFVVETNIDAGFIRFHLIEGM